MYILQATARSVSRATLLSSIKINDDIDCGNHNLRCNKHNDCSYISEYYFFDQWINSPIHSNFSP